MFRREQGRIKYLLLQASYSNHHWTPPKGTKFGHFALRMFIQWHVVQVVDRCSLSLGIYQTPIPKGEGESGTVAYREVMDYRIPKCQLKVIWWLSRRC